MLPIVYVADQKAVKLLIISASSVLRHNPDAEFIVISESALEMSQFSYITGRNYTNYVYQIPQRRLNAPHVSNAAYLKLEIPYILQNYTKCIYLDADTVCQGSLDGIDSGIVRGLGMCESWLAGKSQAQSLGHERYFNSGVMVMNLDVLRDSGFKNACLAYEHIDVPMYAEDETLINCGMYDEIQLLPQKYNYCHRRTYEKDRVMSENEAVILHYIGADKSDMLERGKKIL